MGISIPADTQTTPKDTIMSNTDLMIPEIPPIDPPPEYPPHPHPHPSTSSPLPPPSATNPGPAPGPNPEDLDAIFKDLAYLDTTEWSSNREAGLKDFGFLDDSTFQAFCHDPDRLGSQPLVHPPSIADIWPPPGFFPETFRDVE
jgi:hypothetical protein